jgi:hypothetical protein
MTTSVVCEAPARGLEENREPSRLVRHADYGGYWSALWLQRRTTVKRRLFIAGLILAVLLLAGLGAIINPGSK